MPRIAAAVGVFGTIAVLTFINIRSYPAVWDMVGSSPWFNRHASSAPPAVAPQPEAVAEADAQEAEPPRPELKSLADSQLDGLDSSSDRGAEPMGFEPRAPLPWESSPGVQDGSFSQDGPLTGDADKESGLQRTIKAESVDTAAYGGLNLGPIKISETPLQDVVGGDCLPAEGPATLPAPSGSMWPAEMSPRMKYAAKPPLLETYQKWNPERPVVPVRQRSAVRKPGMNKPHAASGDKVKPDAEDSSRSGAAIENAKRGGNEVVRHLPPVDPNNRPIRMSISTDGPIPVYPRTDR